SHPCPTRRSSDLPVFPEVGSTTVPPVVSLPSASARSIILRAIRSLMDPPGFINSHLTRIVGLTSEPMELSLTNGVLPMSSRIVSAYFGVAGVGCFGLIIPRYPLWRYHGFQEVINRHELHTAT